MRPQTFSVNAGDASLGEARCSRELNVRCKRSVSAGCCSIQGRTACLEWTECNRHTMALLLKYGVQRRGRYLYELQDFLHNDLEVLFFHLYVALRT
jgi:hypothetical protein